MQLATVLLYSSLYFPSSLHSCSRSLFSGMICTVYSDLLSVRAQAQQWRAEVANGKPSTSSSPPSSPPTPHHLQLPPTPDKQVHTYCIYTYNMTSSFSEFRTFFYLVLIIPIRTPYCLSPSCVCTLKKLSAVIAVFYIDPVLLLLLHSHCQPLETQRTMRRWSLESRQQPLPLRLNL